MAGEEVPGGISPDQLVRIFDGSTLDEFRELSTRIDQRLAEQTRLGEAIASGSRRLLAETLGEMFAKEPELADAPILRRIEAEAKPQHVHTPLLDACIDADVPAYLHGEGGSGKSTAAENAAARRGVNLRAISLSPATSEAKLVGFIDAGGTYHSSGFREIYEEGGIYLFDEMDNGNPGIIALMNRALSGWENEFPDKQIERNWNTRIVAAANTIGKGATAQYVGRNPIDGATLDRFAFIPWDIDEHLENELVKVPNDEPRVPVVLDAGGIPSRVEWLDEVRGYRSRVNQRGMRVLISPRSAIYGAKLAEHGVGVNWLSEMLIFKGMSDTDKDKIRS